MTGKRLKADATGQLFITAPSPLSLPWLTTPLPTRLLDAGRSLSFSGLKFPWSHLPEAAFNLFTASGIGFLIFRPKMSGTHSEAFPQRHVQSRLADFPRNVTPFTPSKTGSHLSADGKRFCATDTLGVIPKNKREGPVHYKENRHGKKGQQNQ